VQTTIDTELSQLLADLDEAVGRAVENPLLFVNSPLLHQVGAACSRLMGGDSASEFHSAGAAEIVSREALLWQIRARAGRLQMLMDSASQFYSNCFSSSEPEGLAYGVHGEWSAPAGSTHLMVEC
jgi:hypothetical protein